MPRVCGRPIYYDECRPNLYPLNLPLGLCTVECRAGACCLAGDWDGRWWFLVPWYVYYISVWVYEASRVARSALHTGSERTDAHDEVDDELPPMKHARCNTCCVRERRHRRTPSLRQVRGGKDHERRAGGTAWCCIMTTEKKILPTI